MPPNFSLFSSESEKIDIQQYINNTMNNKDENEINNTSSDNYYCQLCEIRFSKYIEHVESDKHLSKVKENKFLFKVIKERLRRLKRKERKEGRIFYKEIIKKRKYCEYLLNKRIGA